QSNFMSGTVTLAGCWVDMRPPPAPALTNPSMATSFLPASWRPPLTASRSASLSSRSMFMTFLRQLRRSHGSKLSSRVNCGEHKPDQDADDGNHDEAAGHSIHLVVPQFAQFVVRGIAHDLPPSRVRDAPSVAAAASAAIEPVLRRGRAARRALRGVLK